MLLTVCFLAVIWSEYISTHNLKWMEVSIHSSIHSYLIHSLFFTLSYCFTYSHSLDLLSLSFFLTSENHAVIAIGGIYRNGKAAVACTRRWWDSCRTGCDRRKANKSKVWILNLVDLLDFSWFLGFFTLFNKLFSGMSFDNSHTNSTLSRKLCMHVWSNTSKGIHAGHIRERLQNLSMSSRTNFSLFWTV